MWKTSHAPTPPVRRVRVYITPVPAHTHSHPHSHPHPRTKNPHPRGKGIVDADFETHASRPTTPLIFFRAYRTRLSGPVGCPGWICFVSNACQPTHYHRGAAPDAELSLAEASGLGATPMAAACPRPRKRCRGITRRALEQGIHGGGIQCAPNGVAGKSRSWAQVRNGVH